MKRRKRKRGEQQVFQAKGTATKHSTNEIPEAESNIVPLGLFVWRAGVGQVASNKAGSFVLDLHSGKPMTTAELSSKGH